MKCGASILLNLQSHSAAPAGCDFLHYNHDPRALIWSRHPYRLFCCCSYTLCGISLGPGALWQWAMQLSAPPDSELPRQYRHSRAMACKLMPSNRGVLKLSCSFGKLFQDPTAPVRDGQCHSLHIWRCVVPRPSLYNCPVFERSACACEMLSHVSHVVESFFYEWIDCIVLCFSVAFARFICHIYRMTSVKANVPWNVLRENATLLRLKTGCFSKLPSVLCAHLGFSN